MLQRILQFLLIIPLLSSIAVRDVPCSGLVADQTECACCCCAIDETFSSNETEPDSNQPILKSEGCGCSMIPAPSVPDRIPGIHLSQIQVHDSVAGIENPVANQPVRVSTLQITRSLTFSGVSPPAFLLHCSFLI